MGSVYFWTIVAYLAALVAVGAWRSRGVRSQEDFSVAGRQLSTFVLFGTMLATWIGTGSIFGNAGKTYEVGIAAWILPLGSLAGIGVLWWLSGRARRFAAITVQDILETRYNKWVRLIGVVTLVLTAVTIVSYQYRAAAAVLNLALPSLDPATAALIAAVFIIVYTALAGMVSVAYTDLVMGVTMIGGMLITFPFVWSLAGGPEGMAAVLPPSHMEWFGPIGPVEALGLVLPAGLLILGDANMYQRFFSARDEGSARRSTLWLLAGVAYMELMIILTAWMASAIEWQDGRLAIPGRIIAYIARDHLPVWLGAIVLTTIMAIIVSTSISYLLVPATSLVRDVYQRFVNPAASDARLVGLLRATVVGLGVLAYIISTYSDRFLEVALRAYTIYGTGVTPSLVAALTWRRATSAGAITSGIAGVGMTLIWEFGGWGASTGVDPVIPAILLSVSALVVVSLATPPPRPAQIEPFFGPGRAHR